MKRCATIIVFGLLSLFSFVLRGEIFAAASAGVDATVKISICGNNIKEGAEQCDGSDAGGRSCSYLGYSGGTLACTVACEFDTASCTTTAEENAIPIFTAALGGSYTLSDDTRSVAIDLPGDFYPEDLRLQMFAYAPSTISNAQPAISSNQFIGKTYDFKFVDPDGRIVTNLSKSATLAIIYTDDDVSGIDESTIRPYHWGDNDTSWQPVLGATINTSSNTVTFTSSSFSSFALFGAAPAPTVNSGGGGGGGSGSPAITLSTTGATFEGKAYPLSKVILLKDAQIVAQTIAGNDARFRFNLSGLTPASYLFSLYAEDRDGLRSPTFNFPISVNNGTLINVGNIFIAPTLAADKTQVERGKVLTLFGQTAPDSNVTITVNSDTELFKHISVGKDGVYVYDLDTAELAVGDHHARSRTTITAGTITGDSPEVAFSVGTKTVAAAVPGKSRRGDFTGDGRVNISDFSVLAYWYHRAQPPSRIDLNADHKVDLVDFSILAFYWTG